MNRYAMTAFLGLTLLSGPALAQSGPAFDCSKAEHEIETLICKDGELAAQDRKMDEVFKQAVASLEKVDAGGPEALAELKAYQRGWIGGRNDCWKEDDKKQCALGQYQRRIAELQAKYFLLEGSAPVAFACEDNSEIVATFIETEPRSVRLERGDSTQIGILTSSDNGDRYDAEFGVYFTVNGGEAQVAWPQETEFKCQARN